MVIFASRSKGINNSVQICARKQLLFGSLKECTPYTCESRLETKNKSAVSWCLCVRLGFCSPASMQSEKEADSLLPFKRLDLVQLAAVHALTFASG